MVVPCAIQSSSRSTSIQQWLPHCSASVSAGEFPKALVPALRSRIFSPSKILNTEARMRRPTIAVMVGIPHGGEQDDEDNLNREQDGGHFDDGPTNTLELLYERLKRGDEVAAHSAMAIARCIQEMAHQ